MFPSIPQSPTLTTSLRTCRQRGRAQPSQRLACTRPQLHQGWQSSQARPFSCAGPQGRGRLVTRCPHLRRGCKGGKGFGAFPQVGSSSGQQQHQAQHKAARTWCPQAPHSPTAWPACLPPFPSCGPVPSLLPYSVSFQGKFLHKPGWWSGREVVRHGGAGRPKALLMAILNGTGRRDRTACAVHSWRGVHSKAPWAGQGQLGGQWGPPTPIPL